MHRIIRGYIETLGTMSVFYDESRKVNLPGP